MAKKCRLLLILLASACGEEPVKEDSCTTLCKELTEECQYAAYPDLESCQEACLYYQEEDVNIEEQLSCFVEAECDMFKIVECENIYGVNND